MAFDDPKQFDGQTYTGMAVGGEHSWLYPNGLWRETKVAPDRWEFTFTSIKERERSAPPGSGVPPGTRYHWYLLAHQWVRKIDADSYHTFLSGLKYKVAHRRPGWRRWSSQYPDRPSDRDRIEEILEATLADVRLQGLEEARNRTRPSAEPILRGNAAQQIPLTRFHP